MTRMPKDNRPRCSGCEIIFDDEDGPFMWGGVAWCKECYDRRIAGVPIGRREADGWELQSRLSDRQDD